MEPYKLRCWRTGTAQNSAHVFTCARPGRSKGADKSVPDHLVDEWVRNLPGPKTAIVSLLGRKQGSEGLSEFSFYSFCGGLDTSKERLHRLSFQEWLERRHKDLGILVHEHPTIDFCRVPHETLAAVAATVQKLSSEGRTVVVVDSGGETRTSQVCKYIDATEDSRTKGG